MIINKQIETGEQPIQQNRKTFKEDRARILAIYGGIFPDNIKQFAERLKKFKPKKNFSK